MELWQILGYLHPRLVQFPLVLLLAGLLLDGAGLLARSTRAHWAARILTLAGTVLMLAAFICGIYAEIWAGRAGIPQEPIEWHEALANFASWEFVALACWRLFLQPATQRRLGFAYVTIGLFWYGLLVGTAYLGGQLVFDYGAAVTASGTTPLIPLHDLNTLAQRQTDLNLRYSELMHHLFGGFTFALAASLLVQVLWPHAAARLRWVGPTLLIAGGIFLFFFADLDLYRFTDPRQWRDREVELHKALALAMTAVGLVGLFRPPSQSHLPAAQSVRLVAVMALVGGALLFTHVHTVAPYANVAAGVYIAHVVMGTVALSVGAARLLQDALPAFRRPLQTVFATLLLLEGVLLLTYNEGLPWYIGYGHYNRWGPHGGTVAPFGPLRAELTFDPQSTEFAVHLLDRFQDRPVPLPLPAVTVLIARGYTETALTLHARNPTPAGASYFGASAPFLQNAPAFSARMSLPLGPHHVRMGYFDPWVIPAVTPIPANEVARYQCPMHEGIRSPYPGPCSLCGMDLIPIQRTPPTTLHAPAYSMVFSTPAPPAAAQETLLRFLPQHEGQTLCDLAVVHEHLLHLIITSDDLAYFDHVHPFLQPDSSFILPYTFPRPARYLLFADITPTMQRSQVFRIPVDIPPVSSVPSEPRKPEVAPPPPLTPAPGKPISPNYEVQLLTQPRHLYAGLHTELIFHLTRNGQPLTDLQPYIGALGHCVIVSADTQTYLHSHPEMLVPPASTTHGGPDIAFHTTFPAPGRYKIWGQFKHGDQILVADYVVQVDRPWLPAPLINLMSGEY